MVALVLVSRYVGNIGQPYCYSRYSQLMRGMPVWLGSVHGQRISSLECSATPAIVAAGKVHMEYLGKNG